MPLTNEQLQQAAQQYAINKGLPIKPPQPKIPDYGIPKSFDDQINELPNASKLTDTEKWIYNALPGWLSKEREVKNPYTGKVERRSISQGLENFEKSIVGKALGWLDIPAEGLERTIGVVRQMGDPNFKWDELKAAWYAGSLTGDMTNLPQLVRQEREIYNPYTKKVEKTNIVTGLRIPNDLPGADGLNDARAKIQTLLEQGVDPKEALGLVRDDYYNGLGALTLRAQINDMWTHVVGDPLNFVSAWFKPLKASKIKALNALNTKIDDVGDIAKAASDTYKLYQSSDNIEDSIRLIDEAYSLAQTSGDVKLATQYAEEASRVASQLDPQRASQIAEQLGRTNLDYTDDITNLSKMTPEEVAGYSDNALKELGKRKITTADRMAIMLSGSDPLRKSKVGEKLSKIPVIGKLSEAFSLNPESKASFVKNLVADNLGTTFARMINNPNAEQDLLSYVRRVGKGAIGNEYGHSLLTPEGKTVQGLVSGVETGVENLVQSYMQLAPSRQNLDLLSKTLGKSPTELLALMEKSPDEVLRMLQKADPSLATTSDALRQLAKTLKDIPHNKEMLFAKALDVIETHAMRQAVVQFGVKERGLITRWSDAVKAAESLAFLRLSPAYPVRNAVMDEITMAGRGLFGTMNDAEIDDFWKAFGSKPARFDEGVTSAQLVDKMSDADKVVEGALQGKSFIAPDKIKEFINKLDLGKLDSTYWARLIEAKNSRKATTLGAQQFLNQVVRKPRDYFNADVLDNINRVVPEFEKTLENAIRSSQYMDGKFDELIGTNLNLNIDSVLDDVSLRLGQEAREMLGDEVVSYLKAKFPQAVKENKVDGLVAEVRKMLNDNIEDMFNKRLEGVVEHVKSQAVAGGANVWSQKLNELQDIFWGAHIEYSNRMPEATRLAREASQTGNYDIARALWRQQAEDGRVFYDRAFRRVNAYIEGLEQASAELGKRGANLAFGDVKRSFNGWKGMWEDFFTKSQAMKDEFFDNPKGKNFDDVLAQIDEMYRKNINKEDEYMQRIDDSVASMIPDPETRKVFLNAKDQVAELRRQDREITVQLRKELADLPPELRQSRFNEYWQERSARFEQIRQMDAESAFIQQGNPDAMAKYAGQPSNEPYNIYSLANEYGIPSATEAGRRNDKRVLNIVNKYNKDKTIDVDIEDIGLGGEGSANKIIADGGGINKKEFSDIMGGKLGTDKQGVMPGLFTEKGMGIDEAGRLLSENGLISKVDAEDVNFVRDFIRKNLKGNRKETFTQTIEYKNASEIPEDVARQAFEAWNLEKGISKKSKVNPSFIADRKELLKIMPEPKPIDMSLDMMAYGKQYGVLDEIATSAKSASQKTPLLIKNLPPELQSQALRGIQRMKNDFSSIRNQAQQFGLWRRDSALLNYNRRTNFDSWLGNIAPFSFWSTHSAWNWLTESVDRPAMLTNYMRMKEFMATAGLERDGMASRTAGKVRVQLPFAPEWMGEQFIDPMRMALPFDNWVTPFEQMQRDQTGFAGQVNRTLDNLLQEGEITQDEYDIAMEERSGATWDYAEAMTQQNNEGDRYDAFDFASNLAMPHAPLMWAYNAAFGDKEDIGSFAPSSRIMRNAANLLGIKDWNNHEWNIEAKIRRHFGLNSYDKWDEYRVKRSASDLAGDGTLSPQEAMEAITLVNMVEKGEVTHEEAMRNEAYALSIERSDDEFTGGGAGALFGLLGLNVTSVPKGENNLRALANEFNDAYTKERKAEESFEDFVMENPDLSEEESYTQWAKKNPNLAKYDNALRDFFDENPEYESRLAINKKPEDQVHDFFIDKLWQTYNELPDLNKQEAREHLGEGFQQAFLNKETRDYEGIPTETMQVWMKMMNAETLGELSAEQRMLVSLYGKVQFTEPETAERVQVFYDSRKQSYPDFYELQNGYYDLPKGKQRKQYLNQHPELQQYWDWRNSFMYNNPDIVPYLTDNEQDLQKAQETVRSQFSVPTQQELQQVVVNLPTPARELLSDSIANEEPLPPILVGYLEDLAQEQGLSLEQFMDILGAGQ